MPLTEKGEEIKRAMTKQYGAEKGEKVFYASKNKGTISGVDSMTARRDKIDVIVRKMDSLSKRFDALLKADAFEEASHPRNAGGVFTVGEGEEGREDNKDRDELRTGALSKGS